MKGLRRNKKYRTGYHQIRPKKKYNRSIDIKRKAKLPGKRISKTKKVYYENRFDRSDFSGKKRI